MIRLYQGVDIVEIKKLKDVMLRNKDFVSDIFTEKEKTRCEAKKNQSQHFAGRFAAKEAYLKALGTGMSGSGIDHIFGEIEIISDVSGKPEISVSGWAEKLAARRNIQQATVSISHTADYAVATVILVGE